MSQMKTIKFPGDEEPREIVDAAARERLDALEQTAYTHAIPTSLSMANAIKRARQLTDVEWTAKGSIPGVKYVDGAYTKYYFTEGNTYKGIPYEGGVISNFMYVGSNVDLDTFIGVVQSPESIIYDYESNNSSSHKGAAYYGTVCSKFAQYALNIPASANTASITHIEGMETVAKEGKYDAYDVKLCDVLVDTDYHTAIITDILYDSYGRIACVEISEAVTPTCRRKLWTPEEFSEKWVPGYLLCRYGHINDIPYDKKSYVNIESENAEISIPDYALMPKYGNNKNYTRKNNTTSVVHILKAGYTKAVILRDGVIVSETNVTGKTEFAFDLSVVGHVEMYLEDAAGNKSDSVYVRVVEATIEVTDSSQYENGKLSVKYTGTSGKPLYVQFGVGQLEFCRLDGLGRSTIVDDNNAVLSFVKSRAGQNVRVAYQNEYGVYYSDTVSFTVGEPDVPEEPEHTIADAYLSKATYNDGKTLTADSINAVSADGCWTYTRVPIESNTTYIAAGATRIWFSGYDTTTMHSIVPDEQGQFTSPDGSAYMYVSYDENTTVRGTETIVRVGATNAVNDMLISETGAKLADNTNLTKASYESTSTSTDYFTYKEIPVEAGATYYCRGGTRSWYLKSDGTQLKTINLYGYTDVTKPYTFTVPSGAAYISIAYAKANRSTADMVRIRKLT